MSNFASQGILVGGGLMPILPFVGDDDAHLEEVIRAVKDHGGSFILAGGLSMAGIQAERSLRAAEGLDAQLGSRWQKMYNWLPEKGPDYSPPPAYTAQLGLRVREICQRYELPDRMPRFIPAGKLGINKRIAELLFLKTYELEIEQAEVRQIWAYRKAAWTVDEMDQSIVDVFQSGGEGGLRSLPEIGNRIASEIGAWLSKPEVLQQRKNIH
jgi:DNA repair photolyase